MYSLSPLPRLKPINTFVSMRGTLNFLFLTLFFLFSLAFNALAGGFGSPYQYGRVSGLSGCGTGFRMGAASAFYNPGSMSFLEKNTAALGASFYSKKASYLSPYGGNTDQENKVYAPFHAYGVYLLNDEKSAIGLSVNQPFGFSTVWPGDWTGRYIVTESSLSTIFIQPTYSYKISETFSAGLGAVIGFGNRNIARKLNISGTDGTEAGQEFDGGATGFGVNLGLYYEVEDEFAIGLTYRSAVKMDFSSETASVTNIPASLQSQFENVSSWSGDMTMPSVISVGASYMVNRELTLIADASYTTWSASDEVVFEVDEHPELNYNSAWVMDNTITFRIGGEYELSEKLVLRAGAALDPSPVPDGNVTPELPDADRFTGSIGLTVNFSETFSADLCFLSENTREREVKNSDLSFDGTYKTIYSHFGFTVNLDF
jgi:long-chain fatty acid transport protein